MNILKQIHNKYTETQIQPKYMRNTEDHSLVSLGIEVRCFFTETGTFTVDENFNLARFPVGCLFSLCRIRVIIRAHC